MQVKYLLLFPLETNITKGDRKKLHGLSRGPYFLDIDIDVEVNYVGSETVLDHRVSKEIFIYDDSVSVFQFTYEVGAEIDENLIDFKSQMNSSLKKKVMNEYGVVDNDLIEEYSVLLIKKNIKIRQYVDGNKFLMARLIRSLDKKIQKEDADEVLTTRVGYSKDDLAIVDWEGAILIDAEGDFEEQLELFRVGNYQLLRYRILDKQIQRNLQGIKKIIDGKKKWLSGKNLVKTAVENRLSLLLDFDKIDQSILLVGDWYSSKLYRAIMQEFYLDDWKDIVKNKLENLEAIDTTARENLVFNWSRLLDIIQIVGWMVLLVGYFLLYFKDAGFWK